MEPQLAELLLGFCLTTLFCLFESHAPLDDRALADGSSAIRNTSGMTALVSRRRLQRALGMENGRATWLDAVEPIVERLQETKEEEILLVEANHSSVGRSRTSIDLRPETTRYRMERSGCDKIS